MSNYTTSLGLEEINPGDQAGLWGNTTNNNLALIDQAITGVTPISFASLSGSTYTLTDYNGAFDEARSAVLNITGSATGPNTVVVPNKQKTYLVRNFTGQSITFQTASPGDTYPVLAGNSILIFCDGNNNVYTGIISPSSGTLGVPGGGTGTTNFASGGGFVISPGGSGNLTSIPTIPLDAASGAVSDVLPVANGGTGQYNLPSGYLLIGNGASAVSSIAPGPNTYVLTSNGSVWSAQAPTAAGVTSFNTRTGPVTPQSSDYSSYYGSLTGANSWTNTNSFTITPTVGSYSMLTTNTGGVLTGSNSWTGANTFGNNGAGTGTPIYGSTNGAGASAGYLGQIINSSSSNTGGSGSDIVITSITLTPGDWDINGQVSCNTAGILSYNGGINVTTSISGSTGFYIGGATFGPISMPIPYTPTNVTTNTTIYLLGRVSLSGGGSVTMNGSIYARRIR